MDTSTMTEIAYRKLKEAIVTCEIEPGAQVTEGILAKDFQLSKMPLRAALSRLVQDGLISAVPRQGYIVAPVSLRDADELFAMRLLLEPEATRLAAGRVDVANLRRLDGVRIAEYKPGDRQSERRFLRLNKEFHVEIAKASGNRRLAHSVSTVLDEIERIQHIGMTNQDRSVEIRDEHAELIDVLEAGDGEAAAQMMVGQIKAAERMVLNVLLKSSSLRDIPLQIPT